MTGLKLCLPDVSNTCSFTDLLLLTVKTLDPYLTPSVPGQYLTIKKRCSKQNYEIVTPGSAHN